MKPEQLDLKTCWATFKAAAIPEGAPKVQEDAMRQAFLAGASTVLSIEQALRKSPLPHARKHLDQWNEDVTVAIEEIAKPVKS